MEDRKKAISIVALTLAGCAGMAAVDGWLQPSYPVKSAVKLVLFLLLPLCYALFTGSFRPGALFRASRRGFLRSLLLGLLVFGIILGGYFTLRNVFDFSAITSALTDTGVRRENFLWVALYISFVNSLLEEFFFRGFAFFCLKLVSSARAAYAFSAAAFSLYHIAIMAGWLSWGPFLLILAGLAAGGVLFSLLDAKSHSILPSWFVHMFSNFATNAIGLMLFGLL